MKASRTALAVWMLLSAAITAALQDSRPVAAQDTQLTELQDKYVQLEAENAELRAELEGLRAELLWVSEMRYTERLNHQRWVEIVSAMKPKSIDLVLPIGLEEPGLEAGSEPAPPDPSIVRAGEMVISLRNLFKSEGLFAYDLLEGGRYHDGLLGPVVFRLLDDRGRLAGSLAAAELSFEAGRAGHMVTLVLKRGEERRSGLASPFAERRLPLLGVDPAPWIAKLPELFPAADLGRPIDDGKWDRAALRTRLNRLFARDVAAGYLRLESVDGVSGRLMFGVDFVELDAEGRVKRHLFADTADFAQLDRGIVLQLYDCVAIRGGVKAPFPGGVHRVFLPRADQATWRAAKIPGLTAPE